MRKLATFAAVAAVAAFGFVGAAMADDFADAKESFTLPTDCKTPSDDPAVNDCDVSGDDEDDGDDALGPDDGNPADTSTFTSLGFTDDVVGDSSNVPEGGVLILRFTDNFCLDDGTTADDFEVFEVGGAAGTGEDYDVDAGLISVGTFTAIGSSTGGDEQFDLNSPGVSFFNRIRITATSAGSGGATFTGADIDAVECFFTVDQADIVKVFAVHGDDGDVFDEIDQTSKDNDIGPQFKAFEITITNETGITGGLAGLTFLDTVPAEFDLDPIEELDNAEDNGGTVDDDQCEDPGDPGNFVACNTLTVAVVKGSTLCDDGDCDGIEVSSAADGGAVTDCTANGDEGGAKGKGKGNQKLAPEVLTMTAAGLDDTGTGESCTIKVWVMTDDDHPGRGQNPDFTPTSCPVTLNDGVKVFDASFNLLLQDDDSLIFDDNDPVTEGVCNPA